jgi:NRPS condensation-like uncharacterized protein
MTIRTDVPPAVGRDSRSANRPFGVVDELNCYFDSAAEPNNVHVEAWLPGRLSPERLGTATAALLADVPAARARRAAGPWWRPGYAWEAPREAGIGPVSVIRWETDAELDAARTRFLAAAPDLDHSPPFRLLLAQGPEWDSVILNAHHAAFDGRSCVQLLRLIADRYSGRPPRQAVSTDPAGPDPAGTAPPRSSARAAARGEPRARALPLSARIASRHAGARAVRGAPGCGLWLLEWPGVPVPPQPGGGPRVTVNDLLVAALMHSIARWNTQRLSTRWPAPIRVTMPIDTRAPGHGDDLGNLARLCTITAGPQQVAAPAAIAEQTAAAKAAPGPADNPALMMLARTPLPFRLKRGLARLALHTLGRLVCDSSLLSNLGNVTDPPAFEALTPTRMWFSTSAHMPRGLSVGAITVGGRLQLCFRYQTALLDAAAARDFAAEYAAALSALSSLPAPPARPAPCGPAGEESGR